MSKVKAEISNIFTGHSDAIYALEKGNSKNTFFSGSADGFVGHWNALSGAFEKPIAKVNSSIYSLQSINDSSTLLIGELSGVFNAIDIASKSVIKTLKISEQGIFTMAYLPSADNVILGTGDGKITLLNSDFEVVQVIELCNSNIRCISVSPCGKFVVVGASDNQIHFLEYVGLLELKQIIPAHKNSVFSVIYKEGYTLLSGGRDAILNEWKWNHEAFLESQKWQLNQSIPAHNYTINSIQINPNETLFATSSRDKTIKIWDYNSNQLLKVIDPIKYPNGHTHSVNTILWLDEHTLLSTGDDKKIISWKIEREQ